MLYNFVTTKKTELELDILVSNYHSSLKGTWTKTDKQIFYTQKKKKKSNKKIASSATKFELHALHTSRNFLYMND